MHAVLCLRPDSVSLLGPDCGSWGIPARYTTMRSFINAWGAMWLPFVSGANQTIGLILDCIINDIDTYDTIDRFALSKLISRCPAKRS